MQPLLTFCDGAHTRLPFSEWVILWSAECVYHSLTFLFTDCVLNMFTDMVLYFSEMTLFHFSLEDFFLTAYISSCFTCMHMDILTFNSAKELWVAFFVVVVLCFFFLGF